jgi:hypothetical protein
MDRGFCDDRRLRLATAILMEINNHPVVDFAQLMCAAVFENNAVKCHPLVTGMENGKPDTFGLKRLGAIFFSWPACTFEWYS